MDLVLNTLCFAAGAAGKENLDIGFSFEKARSGGIRADVDFL
jgi:hypothetical protein